MTGASEKQHLFDKPRNVKRLIHSLYACCGVLFLLDFLIHRHTVHPWEKLWGFYPLYGFVGCVVLVLVAKWMRRIVMRPPDYYDPPATNGLSEPANVKEDPHES